VKGEGFRVKGVGCRVQGSGFGVQGLGFQDQSRKTRCLGFEFCVIGFWAGCGSEITNQNQGYNIPVSI
jgi:hypothetical protein